MNSPRKDQAAAAANGRMIEQAEETNLEVTNAQKLVDVIKWLNFMCPLQKIPSEASKEELREILKDGNVLCGILNRISPGFIFECQGSSPEQRMENVSKFLSAIEERGLPGFQASDLEKGSMAAVVECLLTLRDHSSSDKCVSPARGDQAARKQYSLVWGEERRKSFSELRFQRMSRSPRASEQLNETSHHVGQKFHEVFQLKQGRYSDLPAAKISEMLKSNSLDIAPTQSLLSVVNGILDESIERKNGEIPQRVACLLRRVVQEIERRISTQAEYIRNQNNLIKAREEKYQSRIRVLETLATGTSDETQIVMDQLKQIKVEKIKMEERKKNELQDVVRLAKEKENSDNTMSALKEEVEITRKKYEERCVQLEVEAKKAKMELEKAKEGKMELEERLKGIEYLLTESRNRTKELEVASESKGQTRKTYEERCVQLEVEAKKAKMELEEATESKMELEERLKGVEYLLTESRNRTKELEAVAESRGQIRKTCEEHCAQLEVEAKKAKMELGEAKEGKMELEERLKGVEYLLTDSRNETKELEVVLESKIQTWSKKEHSYQNFIRFQLQALRELRMASGSIRGDIINSQKSWQKEFNSLGATFEGLADAAKNYRTVLAENRKLYNEIQDLKGNIRVYCRVRPFLRGETQKQTILEYIGENGELVVSNPSKQGKDGHRAFKFDKVFGPSAIQEEVFLDTQPLIRSVLDGFNVCIFAYGQTGSGKTYTMTGPEASSEEEWGVNYRALNDLFHISQDRKATFLYEVAVQMVEIYNEQVRDLLTNENSQKRLGISNASNSSGLAVPDASMHPVKSTRDVIELMEFGHKNRAVGATALNQRSSRSHSVLTVHVRGSDLESGAILRGSLHLVDLAGSERVDRSEVTGDRLKEAQHINKSLSALGDVIFALSQKSSHVPYRNSKLTQVLQSSLGGQAKTLMFVQLNPNIDSYSESLSTLKFAERVSGIELGAARSNKEGKDVRELMDQVSSLKDTIARKDEEIERLQLLKGGQSPRVSSEMNGPSLLKHRPSSPNQPSPRGLSSRSRRVSGGKGTGSSDSENSDKHSETSSHQSLDDMKHQKLSGMETGQNFSADIELLGFNRVDSEEKLSDISDGSLSMGADTDGSTSSNVEVFAEGVKPAEGTERTASDPKSKVPSQIPRPPQKPIHAASTRLTSMVDPKVLTSSRKSTTSPAKSSSIKAISTSPPMGSSIKAASTSLGMTSSSKGTSKRWQ